MKNIIIGKGVGNENLLFPTAPIWMKREIRNVKLEPMFPLDSIFLNSLSASFTISQPVRQ